MKLEKNSSKNIDLACEPFIYLFWWNTIQKLFV